MSVPVAYIHMYCEQLVSSRGVAATWRWLLLGLDTLTVVSLCPPALLTAGISEEYSTDVVLLQADFLVALKDLEPSVSADDLRKYDELRHFHNQSQSSIPLL